MKQRTKGKKNGRRREWIAGAGLIAYLIGLLIRIPLSRMIGDKGIGFYAVGAEIFTLFSVVLGYGLSRAVTLLIKYRVRREMFKSARKVYHSAMTLAVILSTAAAAGVFFFAEEIAETLVLEHMGYLAVVAVAPAILLAVIMSVLRGYFQGMGTMIPTLHSRMLEKFIMLAASLAGASITYAYGRKVAALLKTEEHAAAYGAMGAALGITIACALGVLHLMVIKMAYKGTFKQQMQRDSSKNGESKGQIVSLLITTALPYMLCALLYNMNYLADQRIFNYAVNLKEQGGIRVAHWGVYYGKYSVIIGIAAVICTMTGATSIPKIMQMYERKEHKAVQQRIGQAVHTIAVLAIPCAIWLAVLAEPIVAILFTGDINTAVKLVQIGSGVVILFAFSWFFMNVLLRIRKMRVAIFGGLAAFLLHLLFLILLVNNTDMGILAVVCGMLVFWLVACVSGFVGIVKYMQYSQEWLRTFGVTAVAAGVSGLAGMLLCKALLGVAGNVITLLVCMIFCFSIYNVLLVVLKGVREEELEEMPGGRVILLLAQKLHLM